MKVAGDRISNAAVLGLMGLTLSAQSVAAFPQRTAFTNSTTAASKTSSSAGTGTTPAASLTRSCGFYFPMEISLNSWWTEHATFTVATEIQYYVQYNNTKVPVNSTRLDGLLITLHNEGVNNTATPTTFRATNLASLSETGLRAPQRFEIEGIPTNLISLLATTTAYDYAMSKFHTDIDITTSWGPNLTRAVVASPTPYAVPEFAILSVDYYDGTEKVSSTSYTDFENEAHIGGAFHASTIDWPDQVTFDAVPTQFIDWMYEYPGVSSKFPWLSECTSWTGSAPSGAPTVHVVVSTLTALMNSVIATSPGNYGSVTKSSAKTSAKTTSEATKPTTSKITGTTIIAVPTTADQTSKETTKAEDSTDGNAGTTSAVTIPTNNAVHTGGSFTQTQQASTTEQSGDSGSSSTPKDTGGDSTPEETGNDTAPEETTSDNTSAETGSDDTPQETTVEQQAPTGNTVAQSDAVTRSSESEQSSVLVAPVLTLGSTTVAPNSASEYVVSSQTLAPGGAAITFAETTYSLAPSATALVQNGETQQIAPVSTAASNPEITLGNSVVTANSESAFVYESQTISVGGPAVTAGGNTYSIATSGSATFIVENGATQVAASQASQVQGITLGNTVVTANSESAYVVGSQTLAAGGSEIAVGETTYSLGTSDSSTFVVRNGVTSALPAPAQATSAAGIVSVVSNAIVPAITIGSSIVTANSASQYIIGDQTLAPGSSALVAEGTTYSLASSGAAVAINGVTSSLAQAAATPTITVGSDVITANSASEYVIGDQTLAPGSAAITEDGTTYSLASSGSAVIVNGATTPIAQGDTSATAAYVVAGQTLSQGSAVEVSGTTYSLAPSGTGIVLNGQTSALPEASTPAVENFGGAVATSVDGGYVIADQTLSAGADAITVSGTTYSLAPSATAIIVNGQTSALPGGDAPSVATFGGVVATSVDGGYAVAGQTLSAGDAITVSGNTYSLAPSGTAIVVNGQTSAILGFDTSAVATFGGAAATSVEGGYAIAGQTLSSGSAITVSGTTYSLAPSGAAVVVNGETSAITGATAALSYAIGSTTLTPGAAVTISGTTYSLESGRSAALVVNGVTSSLASPKVFTLDGETYTAIPAVSGVVIGSQTLLPGDSITITASDGDTETLALVSNGVLETVEASGTGAAIISGLLGSSRTSSSVAETTGSASRSATGGSVEASATASGTSTGAAAQWTSAPKVVAVIAAVVGVAVL